MKQNKIAAGQGFAFSALLVFAAIFASSANAISTVPSSGPNWPDNGYIIDAPRVVGGMPPGVVTIVNPGVVSGPVAPPTDATWPDNGYIIGGNGWLAMAN